MFTLTSLAFAYAANVGFAQEHLSYLLSIDMVLGLDLGHVLVQPDEAGDLQDSGPCAIGWALKRAPKRIQ
jgi:hypothetical protein